MSSMDSRRTSRSTRRCRPARAIGSRSFAEPMAPIIRLAQDSDGAAIADIYRPAVASAPTSFETEPPDAAEMGRRIAHTLPAHPWIVCEVDGHVVGYAYAGTHHERAAYRWSV